MPVASKEILQALVSTVVGLEDPRSGKIVCALQLGLPPLIPGGLAYLQEMAAFFKQLGPALARGRVIVLAPGLPTPGEYLRNARQLLAPAVCDHLERGDDPAALWSIEQVGHDVALADQKIRDALELLEPNRDAEIRAAVQAAKLQLVDHAGESSTSED